MNVGQKLPSFFQEVNNKSQLQGRLMTINFQIYLIAPIVANKSLEYLRFLTAKAPV